MRTKIGMNDKVICKLTKNGRDILFGYYYNQVSYQAQFTKEDVDIKVVTKTMEILHFSEGSYKFQLWEFMNIFGEHLSMGMGTQHVITEGNVFEVESLF